eukprot:11209847-Lingulodinium_polyedra.AAC.1
MVGIPPIASLDSWVSRSESEARFPRTLVLQAHCTGDLGVSVGLGVPGRFSGARGGGRVVCSSPKVGWA